MARVNLFYVDFDNLKHTADEKNVKEINKVK